MESDATLIETLEALIDSTPVEDQVAHDRLHLVWSELVKREEARENRGDYPDYDAADQARADKGTPWELIGEGS